MTYKISKFKKGGYAMNLNNIHVNDNYNYKTLCELLEEPYKSSCSKNAQLDEWRRYFAWERNGHKYLITKKYDTPLPPLKHTRNKLSRYATLLYPLIIDELNSNLLKTGYSVFRKSKLSIYMDFGFAKNIMYARPNSNYWLDWDIFEEVKSNFFEIAGRFFKRATDNLNKTKKIKCQEVHYIFHLVKDSQGEPINEENEPILATKKEETIIKRYLDDIKSTLQAENKLYILFFDNKHSTYLSNELNKRLLNENLRCEYTIWQFSLFDKSTNIETLYKECFKDKNVTTCKQLINSTILHLMYKKNSTEARLAKNNPNLIEYRKQEIFDELISKDSHILIDINMIMQKYIIMRNEVIEKYIKL